MPVWNTSPRPAEASETALQQAHAPIVRGRYLMRIVALQADGEARGEVLRTLVAPPAEGMLAVYGSPAKVPPAPESFTCVGALPRELVEVEVTWRLPRPGRKRAKHVPAPSVRVVSIHEAAPERVAAPCPVFGKCGGCQLQHLAYPAQLAWKTEQVRQALRACGFDAPVVAPALGCEPPWHYRNHMRFSVNREGEVGLTARGSHHVLPLRACPIAAKGINTALALLSQEPQPPPQALVRIAEASGQLLMQPAPSGALRRRLADAGLDVRDGEIEEELHGRWYRIRPSSFFQTNTRQANVMAELVLRALPAGPDVTLVDAYCGVGTFARLLAEHAGRVVAIEESASAIRDARWNLREVINVEILQAKVEDVLPGMAERLDGLVIDPPRAGCQRPVLDALITRRLPYLVYVSCAPETLARDLAYLCLTNGAYRVRSVQPLDMFPQTAHVETVVTLEAC